MKVCPLRAVLAAFCLIVTLCGDAVAARKVALVIGNGAYEHTTPLANPGNDAIDIAVKLRELGFDVRVGRNLNRAGMRSAIRRFRTELAGAEVALLFYAGHSLQWDGRNYLLPIDARIKRARDIEREAIEVQSIVNLMRRRARTAIVLLDASRDNPIARERSLGYSRSSALGSGLAAPKPVRGVLFAFAAAPGDIAADGEGRNSPFTKALLRNLSATDASIGDVMRKVRRDVHRQTGGAQVPWVLSALSDDVFLAPSEDADDPVGAPREVPVIASRPPPSEPSPPPPSPPGGTIVVEVQEPPPEPDPVPEPKPAPEEPETTELLRYPTLLAPEQVPQGQEFRAEFRLSVEREAFDVSVQAERSGELARRTEDGGLSLRLPMGAREWTFEAVLQAPGFDLVSGKQIQALTVPADGDSDPVAFTLRPRANAKLPYKGKIRVSLWRDGAFIAEAARAIEIVQVQETPSLAAPMPARPAAAPVAGTRAARPPDGAQAENLVAERKDADLTIRIIYDEPGSLGAGLIIVSSPLLKETLSTGRFETPRDAPEKLKYLFGEFVLRGQAARGMKTIDDGAASEEAVPLKSFLRGAGCEIYDKFAPPLFKGAIEEILETDPSALRSIQIYTNDPAIPWEVMIASPGCKDKDRTFLGASFNIARWPTDGGDAVASRPSQVLQVEEVVGVAPSYGGGAALDYQKAEVGTLRKMRGYAAIPGRRSDVLDRVQRGVSGIFHFAGHGAADQSHPAAAFYAIRLEDGDLDPQSWIGAAAPRETATLYFFNACSVGEARYAVGSLEGWAPIVLRSGAKGFVGGLWPIFDKAAADAAAQFYAELNSEGTVSVGEALLKVRRRYLETGDPSYLAYAFYGDVNLVARLPAN